GATAVLSSQSTLDARGATITSVQNAGAVFWMLENKQGVNQTVNRSTSCSFTSGSTSITCAGGSFTTADVRQSIRFPLAFDGSADFDAMISNVNSGTVIVASAAPQTTNSYTCSIVYRDQQVRVIGGNWNMTGTATVAQSNGQILFVSCNECSVYDGV